MMNTKESNDKPKVTVKSFTSKKIGNTFYESVYNVGKLRFATYNYETKTTSIVDRIKVGETIYIPTNTLALIKENAMWMPSKIEPYEDEQLLTKQILQYLDYWADYPIRYRKFDASYARFVHLYEKAPALCYRGILGKFGSGKSRVAETIGSICYRPFKIGATTTEAVIFRSAHRNRGTMIIDENEFGAWKTEVGRGFIQILNEGYKKGGIVTRASGEKFGLQVFNVYCPKIWCARKTPKDASFMSRSISHISIKSILKPPNLTEEFHKQRLEIQNKLLYYRIKNYPNDIKWNKEFMAKPLEPRLKEITVSMISLTHNHSDILAIIEQLNAEIVGEEETYLRRTLIMAIAYLYQTKQPLSCTRIAEVVRIYEEMTHDEKDKDYFTPRRCGAILRGTLFLKLTRVQDGKNMRKGIKLEMYNKELLNRSVRGFKITKEELEKFKQKVQFGKLTSESVEEEAEPEMESPSSSEAERLF